MSYVRIVEFADRPEHPGGGEWYVPDGREGSVRIDRDEAAQTNLASASGRVVTTWTGCRIYSCGSLRHGDIFYMLKYPVPFDYLYEFDAWFQYEHMPLLLEASDWHGCEFFRALGASSYTFAALQYLERSALTSDARNRSVDTPWWHRLKRHEWFDKQFVRMIMKAM